MSFTGTEDHSISLTDASDLTSNHRAANPTWPKGHYFGKEAIEEIFAQAGCVGIRVYYGQDSMGEKHLVVVGVKADEDDLFNGDLCERSFKCPPFCGTDNPLNS